MFLPFLSVWFWFFLSKLGNSFVWWKSVFLSAGKMTCKGEISCFIRVPCRSHAFIFLFLTHLCLQTEGNRKDKHAEERKRSWQEACADTDTSSGREAGGERHFPGIRCTLVFNYFLKALETQIPYFFKNYWIVSRNYYPGQLWLIVPKTIKKHLCYLKKNNVKTIIIMLYKQCKIVNQNKLK